MSPGALARKRGFALVLTLVLLALLVLAVVGLGTLARVGSRVAAASGQQAKARQHARLALQVALGQLQAAAGPDDRVTAMAGVAGIAAGPDARTRHWCGVWTADGAFLCWLASGAAGSAAAVAGEEVRLVDAGTVGAPAANSEPVVAGRVPVLVFSAELGRRERDGSYAYWVGDLGVKIAVQAAPGAMTEPGAVRLPPATPPTSAAAKLRAALVAHAAKLPRVLAYEQLAWLPRPEAPALTPSVLQDNFHHVALNAEFLDPAAVGGPRRSGRLNLNTTSVVAWRGLLESYPAGGDGPALDPAALGASPTTSLPARIALHLAGAESPGKSAGGPFTSVAAFAGSALLADALAASGAGVTPDELMAAIGTRLAVRSDTFCIRAYGDAADPAAPAEPGATAVAEAIVQRTDALAADGLGRKFTVVRFRWLGPADL